MKLLPTMVLVVFGFCIDGLLSAAPSAPAAKPATGPRACEYTVSFDHPATAYRDSCPLGNGHLGAMVFGGTTDERVVLNETGVWSGSYHDFDRPDGLKYLPEIRRLLFEQKNSAAEAIADQHFTSVPLVARKPVHVIGRKAHGRGSETWFGCYQVLGNLWLKFALPAAGVSGYRRELDLSRALAKISFECGGVRFQREAFVSAPDDVIVLHFSADHPASISFTARLDRPEKFTTVADGPNGLLMTGQLENGTDGKGVRYAARLVVKAKGGRVFAAGNTLQVNAADDVVIFVDGLTDIRTFAGERADEPAVATARHLAQVIKKPYPALRAAHVADYQRYFDRMSISLGPPNPLAAHETTWDRLRAFQGGTNDPGLIALYFNFGRYLLISSSRPGGLPANLQGLWADEIQTPWNGDWHLDVNVEMNYWAADVCNLGDLEQPLFALTASLQKPGAKTARRYYGAPGWVAHTFTDPWGFTSPGNRAGWGMFQGASAWLCQEIWDHYVFTRDPAYLKRAYPVLKGAAEFYAATLVREPKTGYLVTAPTDSPENYFYAPDGGEARVTIATTMDMQLLRHLFDGCIEASKILGVDPAFRTELRQERSRLVPTRIGPDGRIMEWFYPYKEVDIHHRHVSHLWGLYPGTEITPDLTPELAAAARKSLEVRGDDGPGWDLAYKTALWARLWDGEQARHELKLLLRPCPASAIAHSGHSGTYPNLFNSGPPFQIDGNLGGSAAIAEMLMQSRDNDEILLLPALPWEWGDGSVRGLRARGGFVVDLSWKDSRLQSAVIHATADTHCTVRCCGKRVSLEIPRGMKVTLDGKLHPINK